MYLLLRIHLEIHNRRIFQRGEDLGKHEEHDCVPYPVHAEWSDLDKSIWVYLFSVFHFLSLFPSKFPVMCIGT